MRQPNERTQRYVKCVPKWKNNIIENQIELRAVDEKHSMQSALGYGLFVEVRELSARNGWAYIAYGMMVSIGEASMAGTTS